MRSLGFACKCIGVPGTSMRACTLKKLTPKLFLDIARHNLAALGAMADYCVRMDIGLLRLSSDCIPLASHPGVAGRPEYDWARLCAPELEALGQRIRSSGLRVSMHPGQYTVLNSPDADVVARCILDLEWHAAFLDALGTDRSARMVLHAGGVYGDRKASLERFAANAARLSDRVRQRLVLENDERNYTIADILELCRRLELPAVMDVFHHSLLPPPKSDPIFWLRAAAKTWKPVDGRQKIHYSQQLPGGKPGMHSATILAGTFLQWYRSLGDDPPDVMLEVKDKNLSAVKCGLCLDGDRGTLRLRSLEEEWSRYKYAVMERSREAYDRLGAFFRRGTPDALDFYGLLEEALSLPVHHGSAVTTAEHVWGYFSRRATGAEKAGALRALSRYARQELSLAALKRGLYRLAETYQEPYLLRSLYFFL